MPKGKNQKFKLYRLAQIMLENTDEEHYITMPEIKEKLEEYEVTADRKSIYNDLKDLEKLSQLELVVSLLFLSKKREMALAGLLLLMEMFMKKRIWLTRQHIIQTSAYSR